MKPTPEEERNGWTEATLTAYLNKHETSIEERIFKKPKIKPSRANSKYSPFNWRR